MDINVVWIGLLVLLHLVKFIKFMYESQIMGYCISFGIQVYFESNIQKHEGFSWSLQFITDLQMHIPDPKGNTEYEEVQ